MTYIEPCRDLFVALSQVEEEVKIAIVCRDENRMSRYAEIIHLEGVPEARVRVWYGEAVRYPPMKALYIWEYLHSYGVMKNFHDWELKIYLEKGGKPWRKRNE